jgi:hypothetical protein
MRVRGTDRLGRKPTVLRDRAVHVAWASPDHARLVDAQFVGPRFPHVFPSESTA